MSPPVDYLSLGLTLLRGDTEMGGRGDAGSFFDKQLAGLDKYPDRINYTDCFPVKSSLLKVPSLH
ncbi:hypothetical protein DSM107003_25940 [Trichormus variabilis SAG 1403-4b]|uniref:Uncharacterized protein n=1 Tax=Trichormus variabilis SAG 1403-4b TaxID=447716 RepID=A0A3S1C4L8_ANAVA|nr:hypothetical protein DSM107003_25940 [Trichormus variabilis SAG 1403-4b]